MPVATSALAFTMLYAVVPNRRIRLLHALAGGIFAALLFEVAKRAFGAYIAAFPTYEAIYGALATVPIFLVWVYLSWLVVLLGAEVTHCLGIYRWRCIGGGSMGGYGDAVTLLLALDEASLTGRAPSTQDLTALRPRWNEPKVEDLLGQLLTLGWVHMTRNGEWTLARRLDDATLMELFASRAFRLPQEDDPDWPSDPRLAEVFAAANRGVAEALDVPLEGFRLNRADALPLDRHGTAA